MLHSCYGKITNTYGYFLIHNININIPTAGHKELQAITRLECKGSILESGLSFGTATL